LPVWSRRQLIDGIRFHVRSGVHGGTSVEYGPWNWVYDLFRRWQRNGTWQRILTRLQSLADAKSTIVWGLSIDCMVCQACREPSGSEGAARQEWYRIRTSTVSSASPSR